MKRSLFEGNDSESLSGAREDLIRSLKREGTLRSKVVEDALRAIPRNRFLWRTTPAFLSYADEPQALGDTGQTISAPHMIVIMLEALELSPGLKVLEIGTGSGYNAARIGWMVSQDLPTASSESLVVSIERDERLVEFAKANIESVGLSSVVTIVSGDGSLGFPQESLEEIYDRILVTAGAPHVPVFVKGQLKKGGILEVPVGGMSYQKLMKIRKRQKNDGEIVFEEKKIVDCMFVPLVGQDAFRS